MKFARVFRDALHTEGYPQYWLDSAVPYGQLKKCLKRVQRELAEFGLDPSTVRQLLATHTTSSLGESVAVAEYDAGEDGQVVDASLSPESRSFLQRFARAQRSGEFARNTGPSAVLDGDHAGDERTRVPPNISRPSELDSGAVAEDASKVTALPRQKPSLRHIEVPLVFHEEFFELLETEVTGLDALQEREQKSLLAEIREIGKLISVVTKPSRVSKSDLGRWREIFDMYLDAQVFFATQEQDHGERTSEHALAQLVGFQNSVRGSGLPDRFKMPASRSAFAKFLALNASLLQHLKFQEINRIAITKILKKFDKRTSLVASGPFRAAARRSGFMTENVAKALCSQVSQEIISVVPRLEDYTCPVCLSIAWLPVRLACLHVFCVRCVIKMQRQRKRRCPLCRADVVMQADTTNLDGNLEKFLKRYFREETQEKQKANEIERGIELFGDSYQHSSCAIM